MFCIKILIQYDCYHQIYISFLIGCFWSWQIDIYKLHFSTTGEVVFSQTSHATFSRVSCPHNLQICIVLCPFQSDFFMACVAVAWRCEMWSGRRKCHAWYILLHYAASLQLHISFSYIPQGWSHKVFSGFLIHKVLQIEVRNSRMVETPEWEGYRTA